MKTPWQLIADSGSTKTTWGLIAAGQKKIVRTQGISPYFFTKEQIRGLLEKELAPALGIPAGDIGKIHYYGTGLGDPKNKRLLKGVLKSVFPESDIQVDHDLMGAARALCGHEKGVACILGTGANSCYFNGKSIVHNNPGLGFILGDEGSGAFLGKKVVQYYLYHTFDAELEDLFNKKYNTDKNAILDKVYRAPYPNRYLASFTHFLSENRGHFMIENIIEDGLNEFFFHHICKYAESWNYPVHFTGGVAWVFRDVLLGLCHVYELTAGKILKAPMEGLIEYHRQAGSAHRGKI